jgi:hypothetical protein
VKTKITIAIAAILFAATVSLVAAGQYDAAVPYDDEPVTAADALPAYEILTNVRSLGFRPLTPAVRRGPYYVLRALDPRGDAVRMVTDAQVGDIVSITRVLAPRYDGAPRIIHVPDESGGRGMANSESESALPDGDDLAPAPPPRRRVIHRSYRRSDAPPPARALSPIYPTPKYGADKGASEKFTAPDEAAAAPAREQN